MLSAGADSFQTFSPVLSAVGCERSFAGCDRVQVGIAFCHLDIKEGLVQSELCDNLYILLPQGCREMSGKLVEDTSHCTI